MIALWALGCQPGLECDVGLTDVPAGVPRLDVTRVLPDRSEVASGFLLFNTWNQEASHAQVTDGCGNPLWAVAASDPQVKVTRARLSRDRQSVRFAEFDRDLSEDRSQIVAVSLSDGTQTITPTPDGHHDFVELPDGRLAWLAWETAPNQWFDRSPQTPVATDRLVIGAEGGGDEPQVLFSFFEDREPFWACSHMFAGTFKPGHLEWTHTNSLAYDDDTDAFFLAVRYWDAVIRVEGDGSLGWELGGPGNAFVLAPGTVLPRHGHATDFGPEAMLFFDNGDHDAEPISRVVEYGIADGVVEETFSHWLDGYNSFLGDARYLPGGNILIARPDGGMMEVDRDGTVVWAAMPTARLGRVEFLASWPP